MFSLSSSRIYYSYSDTDNNIKLLFKSYKYYLDCSEVQISREMNLWQNKRTFMRTFINKYRAIVLWMREYHFAMYLQTYKNPHYPLFYP